MAPKPKEEKPWYEELAFADPDERDEILAGMGYTRSGEFASFADEEGGEAEPFTIEDFAAAYTGSGLPSQFQGGGIVDMPEYTAKGALDPLDLSQYNKRIDTSKDYAGLFVDNALTSMFGPGAYGPDAFTPTYEYGKEVVMKGRNTLEDLASRGGWEGYVADKILNYNMSPSEAMAALQAYVEDVPAQDTGRSSKATAAYNSVVAGLPRLPEKVQQGGEPYKDPATGEMVFPGPAEDIGFWGDYDYDRIYTTANDLYTGLQGDETGFYDEATGKYYDQPVSEIKTPQMEFYDKYGMPYPTESYNDPKYLNKILNNEEGTTPEYREAEFQDYQRGYEDVVGKTQEAARAVGEQETFDREMMDAWEQMQPQTVAGVSGATRPMTQTVPGRAGIEFGKSLSAPTRHGYSTLDTTAEEQTVPTNIMMGGQREPVIRGRPVSGLGGWARNATVPSPSTEIPMVRTLATGQMGLVGRENPGVWGDALGQLGIKAGVPDERFRPESRGFGGFGWGGQHNVLPRGRPPAEKPAGRTRPLEAKDVDDVTRAKRRNATQDKAVQARVAQRQREEQNPRLNDLERMAYLYMLTQAGRTPLGDVQQQRGLGVRSLGL